MPTSRGTNLNDRPVHGVIASSHGVGTAEGCLVVEVLLPEPYLGLRLSADRPLREHAALGGVFCLSGR